MSALELFQTADWSVRAGVDEHGEPWFVAADVAKALGYRDAHNMVRRLDDEDRGTRPVSTPAGEQVVTTINEPGLYAAVLGSQLPQARTFKRWVIEDVLPAIRRTGTYTAPVPRFEIPETLADALQLAADLARQRDQVAAENAVLAPKAALAEACIDAAGDMSVREAAQALTRDHGIVTGQNRLITYLREIGWIDRNGDPYQRHVERGVLAVRVRSYDHPHTGEPQISTQVRVTPKGLAELHRRMSGAAA